MARYRDITPAEMTPVQRRVHDLIIAGRRGRFGGPFQLLIRAPEICEHAAKLGEHLRWGTSLPDRLSELAIITTARFWRAQYEWYAHAPLAEKAGVPSAAIEAIRRGEMPGFGQTDETLVYRICAELFQAQRLSDARFREAVSMLGETGLIEIIAIIGYYTLIGNTLNVFQIPVPDGTAPPFPE
jgi:4-carboxymuconolactone decarboxylase